MGAGLGIETVLCSVLYDYAIASLIILIPSACTLTDARLVSNWLTLLLSTFSSLFDCFCCLGSLPERVDIFPVEHRLLFAQTGLLRY